MAYDRQDNLTEANGNGNGWRFLDWRHSYVVFVSHITKDKDKLTFTLVLPVYDVYDDQLIE